MLSSLLDRFPAKNSPAPGDDDAGWSLILQHLASIAKDLHRIADKMDPPPTDKVGSRYVAEKLGVTTTWIAEMVRKGDIPPSCIVPGSGNGRPWKFYRRAIDEWLARRS